MLLIAAYYRRSEGIGDVFTVRISLLMALVALVILILGMKQFRVLGYPLIYLFLMIPWPYTLLKPIVDGLRLFQVVVLAFALNAAGIPVIRETYFLHLPNMILEVADVCSGLASVLTLIAMAGIHAQRLSLRRSFKLLLIISAAPLAIMANLVRMMVTAILAYFFGPIVFQATLHKFSGTVAFLFGLALLIVVGEILRLKGSALELPAGVCRAEELRVTRSRPLNNWRGFLLAAGLFMLGFHFMDAMKTQSAVPMKADLQELAAHLGPYASSHAEWTSPYQDAGAENSFSRIYEGGGATPVELFVGYRGGQRGDNHLRSPRMFFPVDWNYVWDQPSRLPMPGGTAIDGKWMLISGGTARRLVFYWYQTQGRSVSNELEYRIRLLQSSLLDRRTDGAIIRIATPVSENESIEQSKERIKDFTLVLYPALRAILPD